MNDNLSPIVPKYFRVIKSNNFEIEVWFISVKRSEVHPNPCATTGFQLHHGIDSFSFSEGRGYDSETSMEFFEFKVDQTDEDNWKYVRVGIPNPQNHLTLIESVNPGEYTVALIPKKKNNQNS